MPLSSLVSYTSRASDRLIQFDIHVTFFCIQPIRVRLCEPQSLTARAPHLNPDSLLNRNHPCGPGGSRLQ